MIGRRSRRAARRRRAGQPNTTIASRSSADTAVEARVVEAHAVEDVTERAAAPDRAAIDELRAEFQTQHDEMMATWQRSLETFERDVVSAREVDAWQQAQNTQALTKALDRVADALDGVGNHLQLDRRDRAAQSITVEFLLRELVVAFSNPVPDGPAVLGGTIDPRRRASDATTDPAVTTNVSAPPLAAESSNAPDLASPEAEPAVRLAPVGHDTVIDLREPTSESFKVGQAVEVRSRFQNRWCGGFIVAEVLDHEVPRRYRLLRRLDREVLPVTFEDADLRVTAFASREDDGAVAQQEHTAVDVRLHRA
jgi:hypothetical protein